MTDTRKASLDKCQELFDSGDLDGADALIRPLARFSSPYSQLHMSICDLENLIVDALIDRDGIPENHPESEFVSES